MNVPGLLSVRSKQWGKQSIYIVLLAFAALILKFAAFVAVNCNLYIIRSGTCRFQGTQCTYSSDISGTNELIVLQDGAAYLLYKAAVRETSAQGVMRLGSFLLMDKGGEVTLLGAHPHMDGTFRPKVVRTLRSLSFDRPVFAHGKILHRSLTVSY